MSKKKSSVEQLINDLIQAVQFSSDPQAVINGDTKQTGETKETEETKQDLVTTNGAVTSHKPEEDGTIDLKMLKVLRDIEQRLVVVFKNTLELQERLTERKQNSISTKEDTVSVLPSPLSNTKNFMPSQTTQNCNSTKKETNLSLSKSEPKSVIPRPTQTTQNRHSTNEETDVSLSNPNPNLKILWPKRAIQIYNLVKKKTDLISSNPETGSVIHRSTQITAKCSSVRKVSLINLELNGNSMKERYVVSLLNPKPTPDFTCNSVKEETLKEESLSKSQPNPMLFRFTKITQNSNTTKEDSVLSSPVTVPVVKYPEPIIKKSPLSVTDYNVTVVVERENEIKITRYRNLELPHVSDNYTSTTKQKTENKIRANANLLQHVIPSSYRSVKMPYILSSGLPQLKGYFSSGTSSSSSAPSKSRQLYGKLQSRESFTKLTSGIPSTYYFSPFIKKQSDDGSLGSININRRLPEEWGQTGKRKLRPSFIVMSDSDKE